MTRHNSNVTLILCCVVLLSAGLVWFDFVVKGLLPASGIVGLLATSSSYSYLLFPNQLALLAIPTVNRTLVGFLDVALAGLVVWALIVGEARIGLWKSVGVYFSLCIFATILTMLAM